MPTPCPRVKECPCPYTDCENYRRCCACVINHQSRDDLPRCLRKPPKPEKEDSAKQDV